MKTNLILFIILSLVPTLLFGQAFKIGSEIKAHIDMDVVGEIKTVGFDILYDTTKVDYSNYSVYKVFDHEIYNDFDGRGSAGFNMQTSENIIDRSERILTLSFIAKNSGPTNIVFDNGFAGIDTVGVDTTSWEEGDLEIVPLNRVVFKITIEP